MNKYPKKILSLSLCAIIGVWLLAVPMTAQGAALNPLFPDSKSSIPNSAPTTDWGKDLETCYKTGDYTLFHVIRLIYSIMQWVWGLSGSLALLMFVWGGTLWLISAGSDQRVTEGKTTLINAVIGIIIIFGSWIFINMLVGALVSGDATKKSTIFGVNWSEYQQVDSTSLSSDGCLKRNERFFTPSACLEDTSSTGSTVQARCTDQWEANKAKRDDDPTKFKCPPNTIMYMSVQCRDRSNTPIPNKWRCECATR